MSSDQITMAGIEEPDGALRRPPSASGAPEMDFSEQAVSKLWAVAEDLAGDPKDVAKVTQIVVLATIAGLGPAELAARYGRGEDAQIG